MERKTFALISGLVLVTVVLFLIALKTNNKQTTQVSVNPSAMPVQESAPTTVPAHAVLSLSPNPLSVAPGSTGSVDVMIDTQEHAVTAVQLELKYDPAAISNVQVVPGPQFQHPVILIDKNNAAEGTYTFAIAFFAELFVLFLLSKKVTKLLSFFFYSATRSKKATIYYLALIFFPGTLIHELSHYIMAIFMNVRVGNMEFFPEVQEHGVKLGSVSIAHTDPFRRLLIGMAPFLFGTAIILGILYAGSVNDLFGTAWYITLTGYAVFEIGNTMFSSRKDMEGALELLIVLFLLTVIFLSGRAQTACF